MRVTADMNDIDEQVQTRLSEDIHLLDNMLGSIIRRLEGEPAFALEEEVRAAAQALRAEPAVDAARRLCGRLDQLGVPELRTLTRSFSAYFDLVNLAEQQARVRANRLRTLKLAPQPLDDSPEAALQKLREKGCSAEQLTALLDRASIGCVFTAHPSEARRRTVLEKLSTADLPNLWKPKRDQFVKVEALPVLGTGKTDLRKVKEIAAAAEQSKSSASAET